jgi:DNA invertase Pin-like site-specific DNA recombinase
VSADTLRTLRREVRDQLRVRIDARGLASAPPAERRVRVRDEALDLLRQRGALLPQRELNRIVNEVSDDVVGFGPIESLLKDPTVTEVMVNGPDDVFVEREGRIERVRDRLFEGEEPVVHLIERIVGPLGLRVDHASPWVDARLPDGSRVHTLSAVHPATRDNGCMTDAALYTRLSRDPSGQEAGVRRQEADCRALAMNRGWKVVRVFTDNDRSATSGKARPAWNALLTAIEAGEFGALVAYSSSRLYRRPHDLRGLLELTKARPGFQIATVKSGTIDVESAQGRMVAGILAEVDQAEVDVMRERIARARKQRVGTGADAGGSRPFGYEALPTGPPRERDGKPRLQLTGAVVPEEVELIRDAAEHLLRGDAIRAILRDWEARGVRTPKGNVWRSPGLRHLMTNPRLIGVHPETGERANWPPILDRRTHDALVRLYADPSRLRSRRGSRWLLTGLLFCGKCGGRMTARPSPDHRRYSCDATNRVHLSVSAQPLEEYVVAQAELHRPDFVEARVVSPTEAAVPILAALDDVDARIASWVKESALAGLRASDIRAGHEALAAERAALEDQLTATPEPRADWERLTSGRETREWLDAVIERITIAPAKSMGGRFDPGRVSITWRS